MSILHPFSFWLNYQDCCFITTCSSFKCHSHWKHFKKVTLIGYTIFYDALLLLGYCRFSQWSVPRLLLFQSWGASDGPEEDPKQTKKPCTSMESDLGPAVQYKYPAYILCQAIWLTVDNQYSWTKLRLQPSKKRPLKVLLCNCKVGNFFCKQLEAKYLAFGPNTANSTHICICCCASSSAICFLARSNFNKMSV